MLFRIAFYLKLKAVQLCSSRTLDCPKYEYTSLLEDDSISAFLCHRSESKMQS